MSAQFLKTKGPARLVVLARKGPRIINDFFSLFDPQSNPHPSLVSHSVDSQKRDKHLVPNERPVANKCPPFNYKK